MFKNYLLVTFRNLLKNKVFTIINILGLGVALSVCIVAFFNHMFNYEFDRANDNFDKIYRITCFRDMKGREQEYGVIPATLGLQIKKDIPGVEKAARIMRTGSPVKKGVDVFPAQVSFADPEFLDIFTFPIIYGDKKSIENQGNVLLSETMARTLFGNDFPVGKSLAIVNDQNKEFTFVVGAVYHDLPLNSSFRIDIISHFDNFLLMWNVNDADWKFLTTVLFVQIPNKALISTVSAGLKNYLPVQNEAREDFIINRFSLVPLKDVGSNTRKIWSSGLFPSLHPAAVIAPIVMAVFILLIACFNFANTSIATFSKRMKEIGLRKTFGGQRRQLIGQFMLETLIICSLALLVGIALSSVLVPEYSSLWSYMSIKLTFSEYPFFWVFLVLLVLVTGFIAGVYPAIHVSSFSPAEVMKGTGLFRKTGTLSAVLLTLQFIISVAGLVLGISFAKNAEYQRTLDLGYDRDKLIIVPITSELYTSFRNDVISDPRVISAEGTVNHIGWGRYRRPVKDSEKQLEVDVLDVGPEYAQTMGLRLAEGRLFDKTREAADKQNNSIVVNQKLVKDFGWDEGTGKEITLYDTTTLRVIGVVDDFYENGLWNRIEPAMLRLPQSDQYYSIAIRAESRDLPGVLEMVSQKWKTLGTNLIFGGRLQEDTLQEEKNINNSIMTVNIFLAVVATLLSLIGMFNLVSLDIIRRTKEVGIRKIQGASVPLIMFLISRKFLIVLLIASILGCGAGYYLSVSLMDSIWDYFVKVGAGILITAALIMILATLVTLAVRITRAAMKNPAESLRYE
ncbi:MAG: ABC transporter permease [Bacteroidota bacterium]|nr:ABC transporter permease [Bacteroidota bacterium]